MIVHKALLAAQPVEDGYIDLFPINYGFSDMADARIFMQLCLCKDSWTICFQALVGVPGILMTRITVDSSWPAHPETDGGIHCVVGFKGRAESLFLRPCHVLHDVLTNSSLFLWPPPPVRFVPFTCC